MNEEQRRSLPGHVAMLICNTIWGLMAPISKEALNYFSANGINPLVLPSLRMIGATLCFWILSLFSPKETIAKEDRWLFVLAGLLSIAFNQNLFVCGIAFTSPVDASVITTTLPIITMILSAIVLKEPITHLKAWGVIIGMAGAILLILSNGHGLTLDRSHALGDVMCLCAQVSFACYLIFCKRIIGKYSPVTLMKWMFLTSSILVVPFTSQYIAEVDVVAVPLDVWLEIGFVVFFGTFVTFLIIPIGQRLLRPTIVSSYNYLQPVVSTIASLALGIATFGVAKGIAVALVFTGVILVTKSKKREASPKKEISE